MKAVTYESLARNLRFTIRLETQAEDSFDTGPAGGQQDDD